MTALEDVLDRVEETLAQVGDRFPLHADPVTGVWRTTARGSWAAGCWVGLLWLRAKVTGAVRDAEVWSRKLECWVDADTATQGLIFWYGAAAGERLGLSGEPAELARRGARSLAGRFDARAGVVPWGTAFGDSDVVRARVDGAPGALPLLAWAGEEEIARSHARQHLRLCGERAGWSWDGAEWRPEDRPPVGWRRGAAWWLLAAADARTWLGEDVAVPEWPSGQLDTSADAIAAVALLKLGRREQAGTVLRELEDRHLVDGRLIGGSYDHLVGHELVWGDFFLALALAIEAGLVTADAL